MEPMSWSVAAGLLLKYGPEVVEFILKKINGGGNVTTEEWAELLVLSTKTPRSQILEGAARAGISADDPKIVALLAMVP